MSLKNFIELTKGSKEIFAIKIRDENDDPFDLTTYDKFKVCLAKDDGTTLEVTEVANANGSIVAVTGNALLGKLQVTLGAADTKELRVDELQDIDWEIDITATPAPLRRRIPQSLSVLDHSCAT